MYRREVANQVAAVNALEQYDPSSKRLSLIRMMWLVSLPLSECCVRHLVALGNFALVSDFREQVSDDDHS